MKAFLNLIDNLVSGIENAAQNGGIVVGRLDIDENGNFIYSPQNTQKKPDTAESASKPCNECENTAPQCKCDKSCESKEDSDRLNKFDENDVPSENESNIECNCAKEVDYKAMDYITQENSKLRDDLNAMNDKYDNLLNNYKQLKEAYAALLDRTKGYEATFMDIKSVLKKSNF